MGIPMNRIATALAQWDALATAERRRAAETAWDECGIGFTPEEGDDADLLECLLAGRATASADCDVAIREMNRLACFSL